MSYDISLVDPVTKEEIATDTPHHIQGMPGWHSWTFGSWHTLHLTACGKETRLGEFST